MKIRPVGADLFHAGRRTETTKLKVAFRNFANATKNYTFFPHNAILCFVWISEETALISLSKFNWLVFITDTVFTGRYEMSLETKHYFLTLKG